MTTELPPTPPCLAWNHRIPNPFGYQPSLPAAIIFSAIFLGVLVTHSYQAYHFRKLWLITFVLGTLGELSGWVSRIGSHACPYSVQSFEAQLASLIMAPAFTTAGIYSILALTIPVIGHNTSPLKPRLYLIIFLTVDFFSLLLQGIGGGMAGAAFSKKQDTTTATTIMVTGIIFQLCSTCVFATLYELVLYRGRNVLLRNRPLLILSSATLLSVTCMVIRGVYRSMELLQGWRGYLATNERFAIALEGSLMAISLITFNFFNPERLIREARVVAAESENQGFLAMELDRRDKAQKSGGDTTGLVGEFGGIDGLR
ncbi:hypothetical protein VE00_05712 [Pseudogymnoascus sp. WSF 3629]|nr:hypothetical protein VE00_05712 [Pseudogymnoascus sp. WSF 3629]